MTYDLIIVGAGPAGITAGIYASRKKLKTLLICKDFIGQVGTAFLVENYPGFESIRGLDLAEKFRKHLEKFEISIEQGQKVTCIKKEDGIFLIKTDKDKSYSAKAIIIATGRDPRPLEVPGEKEFLGKGVSYCTTCDGPLFSGKKVAVIGGGNSAFGAALELSRYCKEVYILELGLKPIADEILQEKVEKTENIRLLLGIKTTAIKGSKFVESLVLENVESKKQEQLIIDGVFIQIGYIPATGFVKDLVDFSQHDEIIIQPNTCSTKTSGLFAAGDVSDIPVKQIVTAAAEGAKAALSAYKYIQDISNE